LRYLVRQRSGSAELTLVTNLDGSTQLFQLRTALCAKITDLAGSTPIAR